MGEKRQMLGGMRQWMTMFYFTLSFFPLFFEPSVVARQGRYLNDTSGHGGEFDGHKLQVKCLKAR